MDKNIQNWKIMKWFSTIIYCILCGSLACLICYHKRQLAEISGYWIWIGVGLGALFLCIIVSCYYSYKLYGINEDNNSTTVEK